MLHVGHHGAACREWDCTVMQDFSNPSSSLQHNTNYEIKQHTTFGIELHATEQATGGTLVTLKCPTSFEQYLQFLLLSGLRLC